MPLTMVRQVCSSVSTLMELPEASRAVILACSAVFWALRISISLVLASRALMASAWSRWRLSMMAWVSACLNTGRVMMKAELIFRTRFMLLNCMVLIMGMDCMATFSAVRRSWVRCSSIIRAWFRVVSSNWMELSPVASMSAWRWAM